MTFHAQALRIVLALATAVWPAACNNPDPKYQGWIEANLIFVAPDEVGRVTTLNVREGDAVKVGDPLFAVDDDLQKADLNLNTASMVNARQTFDRAQHLAQTGTGTQKDFDTASAELRSAEARVATSQTRLARRRLVSPVAGTVQQVYFRPGEMVPAGRPVLAILPPGNLKVRFFVPEPVLPRVAYGETITVRCDGCANQSARVSFIAKSAEYTPPVIYSLEERNKLVFLIEALPEQPDKLRVGQPVDVLLDTKT
ncbi:MAG: efflux RND transporter periplasmic adaptor subunit [Xanthobacteraceae bacterium]|nr:efflux RND transporter periplasmic adaptor subunit [Xanthobacteraceae bacterium]MBV9631747.1 efflux RND transporter periplasmic adaptor subunit [Xanthobacteraceae bacterium]